MRLVISSHFVCKPIIVFATQLKYVREFTPFFYWFAFTLYMYIYQFENVTAFSRAHPMPIYSRWVLIFFTLVLYSAMFDWRATVDWLKRNWSMHLICVSTPSADRPLPYSRSEPTANMTIASGIHSSSPTLAIDSPTVE